MNATQEIESGNFSVPRWNLFSPDSIRIVNWNIDRGLKLRGVIEFLDSTKADIILLQEVDLNARRTHHINVASEIAKKLEMNYVFGREFQELTQGSKSSPAYHGQATLSRWPLSGSRIIRFQKQSHFWRPHWFLPAIARAEFLDAFANQHMPTTPGSFLEHGRTIDWVFTRGPIRAGQAQVHRSVSASDHYPQSVKLTIG